MADKTVMELNSPEDLRKGLAVAIDKQLQVGDTLSLVMDFNIEESVILREDGGYDLIPVCGFPMKPKPAIYGVTWHRN